MTQSDSKFSRAASLRVAAFAVLSLGLAAAVRIDHSAGQDQAQDQTNPIMPLSPGDSKRYGYQVGQLAGDTGLLLDRAERSISWLLHGRPLAVLIAITSFAAAGTLLRASDKSAGRA